MTLQQWIGVLASAGGWLIAAVTFTWALSRKAHSWDKGEQAYKAIHGDKESRNPDERKGILDAVEEIQRQQAEFAELCKDAIERVKWIQEGLNAHGSSQRIVVAGVRESIFRLMDQRAAQVELQRRQIIADQNRRFDEADRSSSPGEAPALKHTPTGRNSPHALRADPRVEPDDDDFRSPDDSSRNRALRRK